MIENGNVGVSEISHIKYEWNYGIWTGFWNNRNTELQLKNYVDLTQGNPIIF